MAEISPISRFLLHWQVPAAILLLLVLAACSESDIESSGETSNPVLVLGVDGFEWDVILPLVRQQELPALAALMERGSFGLLETARPTFSPIIWTTVATGKTPPEHGIRGFVRKSKDAGEARRPYSSLDRRTKAFWNILSDFGRRVAVVGWWITYPAEEVNGVMVAQVNTKKAQRRPGENIIKGSLRQDLDHQVHPPERYGEFLDLHLAVGEDLPKRTEEIFGVFTHPLTPLTQRHWDNTQWALRADASYVEIAGILATESFDLLAVYLGGADVVGHRFWRHLQPDKFDQPPPAEELADFGQLIPNYYRYLDTVIGSLIERLPDNTNILIVSDHGMHAVNTEESFVSEELPDTLNSGHHRSAWPGVLIAAGPDVRQQRKSADWNSFERSQIPTLGSILDILPTILTMQGVPVGEDMQGSILTDLLVESFADQIRFIPTHDSEQWLASRSQGDEQSAPIDEERLEQLRALGYIN